MPVAQKYLSAERISMLSALNPFGAAVLGALIPRESFGLSAIAGVAFIIGGIAPRSRAKRPRA